ncbi:MAG: 1,4-dihydroxy-6-naphthoate synthase [Saprospiraceae bacterium]|nr:1,4-dihydroxy-6-naphthoate synthase [Saprospiraceae bacterium]
MKLTLGFSPCPNDTYMFAALVNGWIDTGGIDFEIRMTDVETLNEWAANDVLDISKISFNRALSLEEQYILLSSGAALGYKCGPLVITKHSLTKEAITAGTVALPGKWTTSHLLFSVFYPKATNKRFLSFDKIEEAVLNEEVTAGVIIHENRFTYETKGLLKATDLGEEWERLTGLPIPLGGIFASRRLPHDIVTQIDNLIRQSVLFAKNNEEKVMPYVRQYAQEMDEGVMKSHINLYVNDFSLDLGEKGRNAVLMLKKMTSR